MWVGVDWISCYYSRYKAEKASKQVEHWPWRDWEEDFLSWSTSYKLPLSNKTNTASLVYIGQNTKAKPS